MKFGVIMGKIREETSAHGQMWTSTITVSDLLYVIVKTHLPRTPSNLKERKKKNLPNFTLIFLLVRKVFMKLGLKNVSKSVSFPN